MIESRLKTDSIFEILFRHTSAARGVTDADEMAAAHGAPPAAAAPTVAGEVVTALMVEFDGDAPPALLFVAAAVVCWAGPQMAAMGSGWRASTGGPALDRVESSPTPFVLRLTVTLMAFIAVRPTVSRRACCSGGRESQNENKMSSGSSMGRGSWVYGCTERINK